MLKENVYARRKRHARSAFPCAASPLLHWLGAAAAMALVAGCAVSPAPGAVPDGTGQQVPAAAVGSPTPFLTQAPQVDTSDWKSFETFGVGFKYPAEWKVVAKKDCQGCEPAGDPRKNPYAKWNVLDANGIEIAEFSADSADDNDGDATYVRTRLETIELDSNMATPTVVLFEHSMANTPTRENYRTAALMVDDAILAAERDEFPQIAYFRPRKGVCRDAGNHQRLPQEPGVHGAGRQPRRRHQDDGDDRVPDTWWH